MLLLITVILQGGLLFFLKNKIAKAKGNYKDYFLASLLKGNYL